MVQSFRGFNPEWLTPGKLHGSRLTKAIHLPTTRNTKYRGRERERGTKTGREGDNEVEWGGEKIW